MKRTLVISDIHGELNKFEVLLKKVKYNPNHDQLFLLGDYIDRGPNSRGVIEKVMTLIEAGARALKGNHEDMMIKALTLNEEKAWNRWVKINGGGKTLLSYGFSEGVISGDNTALQKSELNFGVLERHLEFVQSLEHYIETEEYIFVHGGVHPATPVAETDPHTLMWIREEFHHKYFGEKTVIFGHTETKSLHCEEENYNVYFGKNRIIGIDGGAVYGGQLNCLELPSGNVYSVNSQEPL